MKSRIISIICSVIGFGIFFYLLIVGLESINATGWDRLGVIFIGPAIIGLIIILLDFLITIRVIKKGLIYSYISSLIKIILIGICIYWLFEEYRYMKINNLSNFYDYLIIFIILILFLIPLIINIIKLKKK